MRLETERLILRPFEARDRDPFADLSADPDVMRHFPRLRPREESLQNFDRMLATGVPDEIYMHPAELKKTGEFTGFVGLNRFTPEVVAAIPGHPEIEIGWRLHKKFWGQGLAPEAARAWLAYGFDELGLNEIVAITAVANTPSRRVMEKIGMIHDPAGDFDHPAVPEGNPVRRHVLYRIANSNTSNS